MRGDEETDVVDVWIEGIRRILEIVTGEKVERGTLLPTDKIGKATHSFSMLAGLTPVPFRIRPAKHDRSNQRPSGAQRRKTRSLNHVRSPNTLTLPISSHSHPLFVHQPRIPRPPQHRHPSPSPNLRPQHPQTLPPLHRRHRDNRTRNPHRVHIRPGTGGTCIDIRG